MNNRGFTLLELLVAIAILSLTAGSAVLFVPTLTARAEIREVGARLDQLLQETRIEALKSGAPAFVRLNKAEMRLVSSGSRSELVLPMGASATIDGASTTFDRGVRGDAMILFLADGSSSGGLIDIRLRGFSVKRRVSWITGQIDVKS